MWNKTFKKCSVLPHSHKIYSALLISSYTLSHFIKSQKHINTTGEEKQILFSVEPMVRIVVQGRNKRLTAGESQKCR